MSKTIELKDNSKRAKNLIIVFYIIISITVIAIISGIIEYSMLKEIQNGVFPTEESANMIDLIQGVIGIFQTIIYIISVVVFLNWFRRAYGNLHRIGLKYLKHTESMAIWNWFIPILSLFRPFQMMNEIWEETHEEAQKRNKSFTIKSGGIAIGLWWFFYIVSNILGRFILRKTFQDEAIEDIIQGAIALIISDGLQVIEAIFVIYIVSNISKAENILKEDVLKQGGKIIK